MEAKKAAAERLWLAEQRLQLALREQRSVDDPQSQIAREIRRRVADARREQAEAQKEVTAALEASRAAR